MTARSADAAPCRRSEPTPRSAENPAERARNPARMRSPAFPRVRRENSGSTGAPSFPPRPSTAPGWPAHVVRVVGIAQLANLTRVDWPCDSPARGLLGDGTAGAVPGTTVPMAIVPKDIYGSKGHIWREHPGYALTVNDVARWEETLTPSLRGALATTASAEARSGGNPVLRRFSRAAFSVMVVIRMRPSVRRRCQSWQADIRGVSVAAHVGDIAAVRAVSA